MLRALLLPAVKVDGTRSMDAVAGALMVGEWALFTVNRLSVNLCAIVEIERIDGAKRFSLIYLAGRIGPFPPKRWRHEIRGLMLNAIDIARSQDCDEMRFRGRKAWRSMFDDWKVADDAENELVLELK